MTDLDREGGVASRDWASAMAPTLDDFERLATDAWARVPEKFRALCGDVVFRIEDFATDDVLDALEIEDPFDLMGLYQGVSLAHKSVSDPPRGPDYVFLYRRAILDYWVDGTDSLGHLVTHVLVHEIGHHFGLSDADMEAIERDAKANTA
jgi:predicted Zn-dependent protease with MMP-like domain